MKAAAAKPISELGALVDELGVLEQAMAPHAQKLARIELLRKTLRQACPAKSTEEWTISGARFIAVLGVCAMQRSIGVAKLVKAIGAPAFARFATCTLKDLEKCVEPAIAAGVITSDNTGPRSLKVMEKGTA